MAPTDWVSFLPPLAGVLVGGAIGLMSYPLARRGDARAEEDRVLALVAEGLQRPLVDDRHIIGSALSRRHKVESKCATEEVILTDVEVAALFRMLWYFQRVWALDNAFYKKSRRDEKSGTLRRLRKRHHRLLLESLKVTIESWAGDMKRFEDRLYGLGPTNKERPDRKELHKYKIRCIRCATCSSCHTRSQEDKLLTAKDIAIKVDVNNSVLGLKCLHERLKLLETDSRHCLQSS